ncbi:right-handed parallel beta-helix repeat-containing protein [Sphingomonas sp. CCH5-D11]|uniref:right-handed parallel beta-helix repeat-containing protein n=1 Tax=Sphingomonas sp. CCH5-D11 TaxID=1768786 RepID=UPI00082EF11F|nr:glycosyl hydrolase family 28-related protein [Sphingomonas sp. CCH5-D11]
MSDPIRINRRWVLGATLVGAGSAACGNVAQGEGGIDVRDYGAKGDGIADDAAAFQRAIDTAAKQGGGVVTFGPGTYLMRYRASDDGDGGSAITLRSGVTLQGTDRDRCIIRVADRQHGPGTYARTIASKGEIARAALRSFTIDGNRAGQGQFKDDFGGGAVLLGWKGRCVEITVEDLVVRNAVGQGIMLQGSIENVSRRLRIANNRVEGTAFIGIQCSQFDGVSITGNRVLNCYDNGIDIYGDDTKGHSTVATSRNATITDNEIRGCSIGVFLETVADSVTARNIISGCRIAGVRVNRIHGEPRNLTIAENQISATPIGVAIGGDTGGVMVRDNRIEGFKVAGVEFSYNVSRITVTANRFRPATAETPIILGKPTIENANPAEQLAHIRVSGNRIPAGHAQSSQFVNRYKRTVDIMVGEFSTLPRS